MFNNIRSSFTDTHTQEERKMSNSSYTSDTARNVQNESEQWSPSSSVQSTSRTRESTNNSLSFVKITKANNKFEDLKSEAMNLWTEGVDLELDSNANSKKKSAWLSQSAFFENDIDIPQKPLKEATSSTVENTRPQQQQTYAEIADNKTPAWALHNDVQPNQHPVPLQQHRLSNHWSPNELMPMQSMMVAPPAFIPVAKPSPKDIELIQYLYHYLHKPNSPQRLQALKKKVDAVLQQDLQEISLRSFSYLLDALTVLLEYEHQHAKNNTIRKIRNVLPMFGSSLTHFIQTYIVLPPDLVSVLRFLLSIKHFSDGEVFNELPKDGILQLYEQMKPMDTHNDMIKLLRQLHMSSDSNDHFSSNDEPLPKVPNAEVVITEVIHKINALEEFEAKKNLPINIPVQEPWANMDITRYMLVHFMLLRDEAVGPLQKVVKGLFKGTPLSEIKEPECAIYEKTTPVSTTLMVSSSESGVVFRLGQPRPNDQLMEDMQEGSLVLLVSEDIRPSESRLNIKKKVAELSMMGKVVRASSSVSSTGELIRLVSIHVNKEEVSKIDWNGHYTMVSTKINAAAIMSILSWLYEQSIDIDKKRLSGVLTPRILGAKNVLTQEQLQSLDGDFYEHVVSTNDDIVPQYLQNEIDVGSIMVKNGNYRAQPKENVWPRLSHQWDSVSPSKRPPLYSLSPSQLSALKFALTHRVAIISGAPGTGKTHLAGKLAQVMSEALRSGQFHQPILVITKSQSTLDQILSSIVRNIPDMIRFGPEPYIESLVSKQATKLAAPSFSDTNFRQYQSLEHKLIKNQSRLLALFRMRTQVKNHAPAIFSTMIPPAYLTALTRSDPYATPLSAWNAWAEEDELTKKYKEDVWETLSHAQWVLETAYLKHNGRGLMPIIEPNAIRNRFGWVANNVSYPLPISDAINWPYEKSRRTGNELRVSLLSAWKNAAPAADQIWHLKKPQRTNLIEKLAQTLLSFIDSEIEDLLQEQINLSQSFDEILVGKLTYLCRFNRIIGMTSDFAAAHRDWVSTLWPRAVIVDEASDMLESTLVSSLLGPRTEHVILLGSTDHTNKPRLINPSLSARNLHVSLFERWKNTANDFALLEEQWRMHSEVADVIDKFNSIKLEKSSLLITAPMASCSENMVDRRYMNNEVLYGITQRAFYLHYTQPNDEDGDETYSKLLKTPLTKAEVDEARFVAFFAVYMSQQPYHHTSITVLTLTLLQKYLIRSILHSEVPKRTFFKSQVAKINLDVVEQYAGRYDNFVIISTATPGYSSSSYDNISCALTRARYGLFVIGKPGQDKAHDRWKDFADYMDERQLMGPAIQLTCHVHGDTIFARKWSDFDKMKNGGCERKCDTLMSDGHVCREDCHFLSHDEIVCQEPCIRLRPSNCNHSCGRKCYECAKDGCCPPCMVESQIELPCGHTYRDVCHKLLHLDEVKCREVVDVSLPCGHVAPVECCRSHQVSSIICKKKTEVELDCGHIAVQTCGMDVVCMEVCKERLECGHLCHELVSAYNKRMGREIHCSIL